MLQRTLLRRCVIVPMPMNPRISIGDGGTIRAGAGLEMSIHHSPGAIDRQGHVGRALRISLPNTNLLID